MTILVKKHKHTHLDQEWVARLGQDFPLFRGGCDDVIIKNPQVVARLPTVHLK